MNKKSNLNNKNSKKDSMLFNNKNKEKNKNKLKKLQNKNNYCVMLRFWRKKKQKKLLR